MTGASQIVPSRLVSIGEVGAGIYATPTHTSVGAATSSTLALAANSNRRYAIFVNDSDTAVYLGLGAAAIVNAGIRLNANGGSYEMSAMLGNLYRGAINAIHGGTGTKSLLVTEGL